MADINFSKIRYKAGTISTEKETMIIRIQGNKLGTITHSMNAVDKCCKPSDIEPDKNHIKYASVMAYPGVNAT